MTNPFARLIERLMPTIQPLRRDPKIEQRHERADERLSLLKAEADAKRKIYGSQGT